MVPEGIFEALPGLPRLEISRLEAPIVLSSTPDAACVSAVASATGVPGLVFGDPNTGPIGGPGAPWNGDDSHANSFDSVSVSAAFCPSADSHSISSNLPPPEKEMQPRLGQVHADYCSTDTAVKGLVHPLSTDPGLNLLAADRIPSHSNLFADLPTSSSSGLAPPSNATPSLHRQSFLAPPFSDSISGGDTPSS